MGHRERERAGAVMTTWCPRWSTLDTFPVRPGGEVAWSADWARGVDPWMLSVRELAAQEADAVASLLDAWEKRLGPFGGDPLREDWTRFRPLRLSREEDWSDWLAHLLEHSEGRELASRLFPPEVPSHAVEAVLREEKLRSGNRADLILFWSEKRASHVEVKIGDESFDKTTATAKSCQKTFADRRHWAHYVLLPDESREAWSESAAADDANVVTWTTVACELRRELMREREPTRWLAFAHAFSGAVEQQLLGLPRLPFGGGSSTSLSTVFRLGRLLQEASRHG